MAICDELMGTRHCSTEDPPRDGAGIYAIFLKETASLPDIEVGPSKLLYVGKSESSLEARDHFRYPKSSSSTLRRSLGAILKQDLKLCAQPRGFKKIATKKNIANYRFDPTGEARLSDWMNKNLAYSYVLLESDISAFERRCIGKLQPPLNLTLWKNPQRNEVANLRRICRDEASR